MRGRLPAPELEAQVAAKDVEIAAAKAQLAGVEKTLAARPVGWAAPTWQVLQSGELKADGGVVLKALPDEDTRERATVYMEGLAEMRKEFKRS